jgi:hypothetical protein
MDNENKNPAEETAAEESKAPETAAETPGTEQEAPETPETFAIVRIFIAKAAMSGTGSAPDASAWRSSTRASPLRPAMAESATANALISTRPP